jgi:cation:H+ antiporter
VITLLLFAAGLVLIVAGSELFTNAVEWAGFRLRLASGATGSLLAAWGTALPETVVPVVAIISRAPAADSVATGAIVGAPFLLLTLGVAVTGLAVLARRGATELSVDSGQARRDLGTFFAAYTLVLIAVALPLWLRAVVAASVIVIYGIYVRAALRGGAPTEEMPEPLHLLRWYAGRPPGVAIAAQLLVAIAMLIVGAEFFVRALERSADALQLPTLLLALVLVPVATELPETLNSILWIHSRDDGLAFGNVAGATAFQACIGGAIGVAFTTWSPGKMGLASAALALLSSCYLLVLLRHGRCRGWLLTLSAVPWIAYVVVAGVAGGRLQ